MVMLMAGGVCLISDTENFVSKLVAAKIGTLVEVENSDLYYSGIDVGYACLYMGFPVRKIASSLFFNNAYDKECWEGVRRCAITSAIKDLLKSGRDVFGFISADSGEFVSMLKNRSEIEHAEMYLDNMSVTSEGSIDLVSRAETPMELVDWCSEHGENDIIFDALAEINNMRSVEFVKYANTALSKASAAVSGVCSQPNAFFESMIQVFIYCRCAQIMREDSLMICGVYSGAVNSLTHYAESTMRDEYIDLALTYSLCSVFNASHLKCKILKKIMSDYPTMDHFALGGIIDYNSETDGLRFKIQRCFFDVLEEEDSSFLRLSIGDRLRISNLLKDK